MPPRMDTTHPSAGYKRYGKHIFYTILAIVIVLDALAIHFEARFFHSMIVYAKEESELSTVTSSPVNDAKYEAAPTSGQDRDERREVDGSGIKREVSMYSREKEESNDQDQELDLSELFRLEATAAKESGCGLSDVFTPEVQKWEENICQWSQEHELDPNLIATVMQIESCGNQQAESATGVRGLFQVTGMNLDGEDPWDPDVSMAKGPGKVLKHEIDKSGGDIRAAMAGYNGGAKARDYIAGKINRSQLYWFLVNHPSRLWWTRSRALAKINEVERYAQWSNIYFEAKENKTDTLQEWLDLGGDRLCSAARRGLAQYVPEE